MKQEIKRLPSSELAVMQVLWEAGGPVTSAYVCGKLEKTKNWKITSVLTFLSRLAKRGFVGVTREGRENIYSVVISEGEYLRRESKTVLERLYGNSVTAFVSSLYDSKSIGREDLRELRDFLDKVEREGRQ